VHPGASVCETSMHYFSSSCGTGTGLTKTHRDTLRQTRVLHPVGSVGHVVHCSASGAQIVDTLFFLLVPDRNVI
jgi:hypothetical protein